MKKLLTTVICSLVGINSMLMADSSRPRLVVGIVVDQLRTDYIEYLRRHFGERGFNLLLQKGAYFRDVTFPPTVTDAVAATALAMTGGDPASNGVAAAEIFDTRSHSPRKTMQSAEAISGNYSPENLLLSTVSDEIAIDGIGLGAVYSIAVDPQQAVIMGGHAGTSAVWLDEESGRWASSGWYKELPQPIALRNRNSSPAAKLDTMRWEPAMSLDLYPGIPAQKRYYPFRYTFPTNDRDAYRRWATSPMANREVTDIAVDYIRQLKLGSRGDAIDMLGVAYTAAPFKYVKDGDFRLELEDTYIRLDRQLQRLFDAIEEGPGLANTVIYLTSTGYYDDATADDPKYRIPGGAFSKKRALSLLNAYLSARFGNADYIGSFHGPQIYLDQKTIETKRLEPNEVAKTAREFMSRMSGVRAAYTVTDILSEATPRLSELRRGIDLRTCGDIYIDFQPGWTVSDDTRFPADTKPTRSSMVSTPAFFMAPETASRTIDTPVDATRLAPTLTQILRIRSPNGAQGRPIIL